MKKIRITLSKDGTHKIEVIGAVGEECIEFTRAFEKRLGSLVGERTLKPEYAESPREREPERERERGRS